MQSVENVVISAAGMGSRLELNMPKCLVEINNKKIIDYQLELIREIPNVYMVVGFMEEAVMEHVYRKRKDVIFVRNADYKTTTNSYSVYLATKDMSKPFVSFDGDLIVNPMSFKNFLSECENGESLVCYTNSKSEDAVFVRLDTTTKYIEGFDRIKNSPYEWSGLAYFSGIKIAKNGGYIFAEIEKHLPIKAHMIDCCEVDTPDDLKTAVKFCSQMSDQ